MWLGGISCRDEYNAGIPKVIKSAGGVVENEIGDVLVVAKVGEKGHLYWSLPKGECEVEDADDEATARREIDEETGITRLQLVQLLGTYIRNGYSDPEVRKQITVLHFRTKQRVFDPKKTKQHPVAVWVQPSQVVRLLTHRKDQEFFESILHKLKS